MITRFDHAVIAVRDLEGAISRYREVLGLHAQFGGRHTGRGTHNGIVRFGLDYLELLAIYDPAELAGPAGQTMIDFLDRRAGGLIGFALATDAIEQLTERVAQAGLEAFGPFAMERARPDGRVLKWRLLVPNQSAWRRPYPFFIQWDVPDEERLAWEKPGIHPLGATAVAGVAVTVRDLAGAKTLYQQHFGLTLLAEDAVPELGARRARFGLGSSAIDLLTPEAAGPVRDELDRLGEGVFQVNLRARDLEPARRWLEQSGVAPVPAPGTPDALLLPLDQTIGARLALVETSQSAASPER